MHFHVRCTTATLFLSTLGLVHAGGAGPSGLPPRVDSFKLYDAAAALMRVHYGGLHNDRLDPLLTQQRSALVQACAGYGQGRCPENAGRDALTRVFNALGDDHTGAIWNTDLNADPVQLNVDPSYQPAMHMQGTVAVIRFPRYPAVFLPGVGASFHRAVQQAQQQGATGLVVDLRGNAGGLPGECLPAAQVLAGDRVNLVNTSRSGERLYDWQRTPEASVARDWERWSGPLALLVDAETASCAEILAYWGQQAGGSVVGMPTAGLMNTNSQTFVLPGPSLLKMATGRNTTDGHVAYPLRVQPDIIAQVTLADRLAVRDPVMKAALQAVRRSPKH